ncbi:MAG: S49 family peptidase [Rhizobiaceae bacterium]
MANYLTRFIPKQLRGGGTTIPVVRLSGAIMSGGTPLRPALNLASCADVLKKAFKFKKSPAVAVVINSPGGSPVQSHLIYRRIRALAEEFDKKVHVFVEDAAASGGYLIACAGDDITADPSSIVGSIGVVSSGFGFVDAIDKLGIQRRVHTAGQNKSVLDPFLPEKKADITRLKELQLNIHDMFINIVKTGRGDRLAQEKDMFTGMFWTGTKGKELGLVDEIGDVRASLKNRYGDDTELKLIEAKRGLFGRKSAFGVSLFPDALENIASSAADGALAALEERALWSRLGL